MRSNAMSRRSLLGGFGGLTVAGGLAACGGGSSSGGDPDTVTFANWSSGTDAPLYTGILDRYTSSSGISVVPQADVSYDDYQTRFRTQLAGGAPPDVMRLNDDFFREIADKNQLLDISDRTSELDVASLYEDVYAFTERPNGRGGLAIGSQPRVVYYNKTLLDSKGITVPTTWTMDGWTWDDFLAAAQECREGDRYGCIVVKDGGYENTFSVNNGGEGIYSADGRSFALSEPEGIEAIQWAADLTVVHDVQPQWAELQPDNAELNFFASGQCAMLFGVMSTSKYLRDNVTDFEWGIAPVPGRVKQVQEGSIILFVIPAKSQNPDGAWGLLSSMVSQEAGEMFASAGSFIPADRTAAEAVAGSATQGENVALFAEAVEHNQSVNSTAATSQAQQLYRPALGRVYTGEVTAEEVLTGARDQINALLGLG